MTTLPERSIALFVIAGRVRFVSVTVNHFKLIPRYMGLWTPRPRGRSKKEKWSNIDHVTTSLWLPDRLALAPLPCLTQTKSLFPPLYLVITQSPPFHSQNKSRPSLYLKSYCRTYADRETRRLTSPARTARATTAQYSLPRSQPPR